MGEELWSFRILLNICWRMAGKNPLTMLRPLTVEALRSSETSENFHRITLRYVSEDNTFHNLVKFMMMLI
jgi:hypothetical protein